MFSIKICGIKSTHDAEVVAESKADAIGLNFYPKSKRYVSVDQAKEICEAVSGQLLRVGVFVNETAERIRRTVAESGIDAVQLHGDEPVSMLSELKDLHVIRAFRCMDGDLSDVLTFLQGASDLGFPPMAVLLDAYQAGEYGGTGKTLDPEILAENVKNLGNVPWVLAGGLTPENVANAIHVTRSRGVDTASGVESSPGTKDASKVIAFAQNAAAAFG